MEEIKKEIQQNKKYQGFRWAIVGSSGSGKTIFLQSLIKNTIKNNYIIYDIEGEFEKFGEVVFNFSELLEKIKEGKTKIILNSQQQTHEKMIEEMSLISQLLLSNNVFSTWTIIIDEAHLIFPQNKSLSKDEANANNIALFTQGRKRGINVLIATQRISLINLTVITQCNRIFMMKITEIESKKYFSGYEHINKIKNLKQYYILDLFSGQIYNPVKVE